MPTRVSSPLHVFPVSLDAIPRDVRAAYYDEGARYLVDGRVARWDGPLQEVLSPICIGPPGNAEPFALGHYPMMSRDAALEALAAARRAYDHGRGDWPKMSVAERIRCVEQFIPRMVSVRDDVVHLLMWEIGKTLPDARKEFDRTVDYIRDTIHALKELDRRSSQFAVEQGFVAQIRRSPLGIALCMGPYNYPLNETFTTLIPALLMGNAVIFKPPKHGVLLHAPLLEAFAHAFPPGVVNTVYGDGREVVGPLMESGAIDVLAFIGSARVASILEHQHPRPNRLRRVLGLEAKNLAAVLPHADLELAVRECALGALSYKGQRCTAIKIIFAHRSIVDEFCERFAASVGQMTVGMPWEEGVQITPLPETGKQQWLRELVNDAVERGAHVLNSGGGTIDQTLYYPAILYPAEPAMRVCQVEQFGPVVPIVPYEDEQEIIDWQVDSPVGQQAALFGDDVHRLSLLIDTMVNQVCRVNINSQCQRGPDSFPFTGRKDSAEGTLSVSDALRVFSIRSLVAAKANDTNQRIISEIVRGRHSKFLSTDFIF